MRWLYNPDSLSIFAGTAGICPHYEPCACYCPPKFIKLEIWGPPVPL
jgi:hypothetical protein